MVYTVNNRKRSQTPIVLFSLFSPLAFYFRLFLTYSDLSLPIHRSDVPCSWTIHLCPFKREKNVLWEAIHICGFNYEVVHIYVMCSTHCKIKSSNSAKDRWKIEKSLERVLHNLLLEGSIAESSHTPEDSAILLNCIHHIYKMKGWWLLRNYLDLTFLRAQNPQMKTHSLIPRTDTIGNRKFGIMLSCDQNHKGKCRFTIFLLK